MPGGRIVTSDQANPLIIKKTAGILNFQSGKPWLDCFLDLSGTDASRANPQRFGFTVDHHFDLLKVGLPTAIGQFVGVAHIMTIDRSFTAYIAYFCHDIVLLFEMISYFTLFWRQMQRLKMMEYGVIIIFRGER